MGQGYSNHCNTIQKLEVQIRTGSAVLKDVEEGVHLNDMQLHSGEWGAVDFSRRHEMV